MMWELVYGDTVPSGLCVCHTCDFPKCVNPDHLFVATSADNTADRDAKQRTARGGRIGLAKLTATDVLAIRAKYRHIRPGERNGANALAAEYGINPSTLLRIAKRETWRHI